jgi:TonB-linked SusC/RagA family outer membrane protein
MRKTMLLGLMCLLLGTAFAQQKLSVIGKVLDSKGEAVPGATVSEKGTTNAVAADDNGVFKILVNEGATLNIAAIGFTAEDVLASKQVKISLKGSNAMMDEVVVTALGITRSKNTLPYAAQSIKGEDISKIRSSNAASALSGKISGLEIRQGNGIGSSTNVVIRGSKSLTGNNQALFVVDGVPVDNTVNNTQDQKTGRPGYEYGNAASDINPDDIASINVLKGAAATALYGSRAANGVIMITTKSGKKGLGVTVNSGVTWSRIDKKTMPNYQREYGAGYSLPYDKDGFFYFDVDGDGVKDYVTPTSEDASFGRAFDPSLMVFQWDAFDPTSPFYHKAKPWVAADNNPTTFYGTGLATNNNILIQGGSDRASVKLGYTRSDEKGTLPNSRVLKNIINFGLSYKLTDRITVSSNINYNRIDGKGRYGTGYSGQNPNQNFRQWYQANVDVQEQKEAFFRTGKNITWNWKDPSTASGLIPIYTDNYYWTRYKNFETDTRSRVFGNVMANYKITDWLNIMGRVTVDNYTEFQDERLAIGSQGTPSYRRFDRTFNETNFDLIGTFDKNLGAKFNIKALAGVNIRKQLITSTRATTVGGLVVDNLFSIANSKGAVSAPTESYQPKRVDGYFGGLTLSYDEFLTLDGTIRRDRSSTLPVANNAYNYYGVSGSWVFSRHLESLSWLSLGKLRLNYATVGNDAPWGSVLDVYSTQNPTLTDQLAPFGPALLYSLPSNKNNAKLKPEQTKSKEIGIELGFFQGRLGLDATYYQTNTTDQIIPVSTSSATGFSGQYLNAGNIRNRGIELSIFAKPVATSNFSWDINLNFTRNRNLVVSLYDTSKNLQLASTQGGVSINATVGQPYQTIQGKTIKTNAKGERLVDEDGNYQITSTTTNVIGNVNPDWIGGITNTFRYKNFSLGFLVDVRHGGQLFSLDRFYSQYTGISVDWTGTNDKGNPVRASLEDGGGRVLPGVTDDGKANTVYSTVDANNNLPVSLFVYDASYVKLREATISYSLPTSVVERLRAFKGIEISLIGRNLWIIHKNLPYSDPEENLAAGNIQGVQSGAYPTPRYMGFNLKLSL